MRRALRPYVTTGVALVGASALALTPVVAVPPDVKVPGSGVELTASPFGPYLQAIEEAIDNGRRLIGQALAEPPALAFTLQDLLDSMAGDPAGNLGQFADDLENLLGPFGRSSVQAALNDIAGNIRAAFMRVDDGDVDLAVVSAIFAYISLTPIVSALAAVPADLLGPELAEVATTSLATTINALTGPAISALGKSGVAVQNIVNALRERDPEKVLKAVIDAPAIIADGILNGFPIVPSPVAFPGILTPGDALGQGPGPVSLVSDVAQELRGLVAPKPQPFSSAVASDDGRVVTFDIDATPNRHVAEEAQPPADQSADPDETTNGEVSASEDAVDRSDGNKYRPGLAGRHAAQRSGGNPGFGALREGIREGIKDLRQGVRDTVKSLTKAGDDKDHSSGGDSDQ